MNKQQIIENTIVFVKDTLKNAEGGHDWFHTHRVLKNSQLIAKNEDVDEFVVSLGALLHDIADSKFHNGDETIGPKVAAEFLVNEEVDTGIIEHVVQIINNISYKGGKEARTFSSKELDVIQDADRLDAIGAIGIARTFNYGGFKNNAIYNPDILPELNMSKTEYKKGNGTTVNHFYEKLLLLKDKMNTKTGKQLAEQRHEYMELYLEQFYKEVNGTF
ncbi:MAG: HD domain-containing protein [Flavobacteriaceae bacterium]|nr:HD domain-containing protein [Flavobacteriaceae bacterium]